MDSLKQRLQDELTTAKCGSAIAHSVHMVEIVHIYEQLGAILLLTPNSTWQLF